jgi:hypothetical protein
MGDAGRDGRALRGAAGRGAGRAWHLVFDTRRPDARHAWNSRCPPHRRGGGPARERSHAGARRWARKVVLAFDSDGDEPLAFAVERSQATRLFSALAAAAGPSRLRDRTYATQLDDCGNGDRVSVAPAHVATPVLRYPEALADRGMPGLAVVSFIVDTTGRALMDGGFRVIFSTHPAFTQAARDAVATSRFRPALRGGVPVRAPVCQSILFMITTNPRDANR